MNTRQLPHTELRAMKADGNKAESAVGWKMMEETKDKSLIRLGVGVDIVVK